MWLLKRVKIQKHQLGKSGDFFIKSVWTLISYLRLSEKFFIQYPGVADGIESDIKNLVSVMTFGNILPKGLYLDSLVRVAREELSLECDYLREAQASKRFK